MIKSLTRFLRSINSKHKCKQHFCLNCLQGFSYEEGRNKHFELCKNNEVVKIEMPEKDSFVEFHEVQKNSRCCSSCMQTLKQLSNLQNVK